jgi:energy-converting hydrogenase A subunit R
MKQSSTPRIFMTDCEGPISKNDNAFELTSNFIPNGNRLFTLISKYDDILADIVKRPGYKAGDTLKLILPFLKAYGVTNQAILEYSSKNVLLVPGAKEMLHFVKNSMPSFIVSTSYEQYMRSLCDIVDFSFKNVYCTTLNLDKFKILKNEVAQIKKLKDEISQTPIPEIPKGAMSLSDFSKENQTIVKRLDEIFWKEISQMSVGALLHKISPAGGEEKAEDVKTIVEKSKSSLQNVMYVGDSITDAAAFRVVRQGGGLTVSFNGNNFAVREAQVVVLAENALVTALLAYVFDRFGKTQVINLIKEWKLATIQKLDLPTHLKEYFLKFCKKKFPKVELVTTDNMERLMRESTEFRKCVRGEAVGKLG